MKFSRIRPFRNYSSNSIRLDMAEMNECPSKEFQTLLVDEIDYLDLVAYPDYEYVSNLERKLVDTYFGLHGTKINSIVDAGSDALIKLCVEAFCPSMDQYFSSTPAFLCIKYMRWHKVDKLETTIYWMILTGSLCVGQDFSTFQCLC